MKYEVDGRIFDSEDEAIQYCAEEMISTANIMEIEEEEVIDDFPEKDENLDESEAMTEREKQGAIILESYSQIEDETLKKQVLSTALGQSTGKAHDKVFPEKRTTANAFTKTYKHYVEELADESSSVCPLCGVEWSRLSEEMKENLEKEKLSLADQHKDLEGKFPVIRIYHIKSKHLAIWKFIKDLFEVVPSERRYDDPKRDDSESLSKENLENLTREELSEAISKDPVLRKEFFQKWLRHLQEKKD